MSEIIGAVAVCKCPKSHKMFGVRFQQRNRRQWDYTWAFPIREDSARREGYDKTEIVGDIDPTSEYPGCPYCGAKYFVICSCGKLNCNSYAFDNAFLCEWCGATGTLTSYTGSGFSAGGDL